MRDFVEHHDLSRSEDADLFGREIDEQVRRRRSSSGNGEDSRRKVAKQKRLARLPGAEFDEIDVFFNKRREPSEEQQPSSAFLKGAAGIAGALQHQRRPLFGRELPAQVAVLLQVRASDLERREGDQFIRRFGVDFWRVPDFRSAPKASQQKPGVLIGYAWRNANSLVSDRRNFRPSATAA